MKVTIEFKNVEEYLEFKEKTAQDESLISIEHLSNNLKNYLHKTLDKTKVGFQWEEIKWLYQEAEEVSNVDIRKLEQSLGKS